MACMKLGSRRDSFRREGNEWYCIIGLVSDITVKVSEASFHLHKYPLVSKSGLLETLIGKKTQKGEAISFLELPNFPFGSKSFELCAKFCYSIKFELTPSNAISLFCGSKWLEMTEEISQGNLIFQTEIFLNNYVLRSWKDCIKALQSCNNYVQQAEEFQILNRCIESVANMCFTTRPELSNLPENWNGIGTSTEPINTGTDWWYDDLSTLGLPLLQKLVSKLENLGMDQDIIIGLINYYAKKWIPGLNRRESGTGTGTVYPILPDEEQRTLIEMIEKLLPFQKGAVSCKFLFSLLKTAKILKASETCVSNLEKRIGVQLDEAALEDLLIPNFSNSIENETLYDVDCICRILNHFLSMNKIINGDVQFEEITGGIQLSGSCSDLDPVIRVAKLIDGYLAEVGSDLNLKFEIFKNLVMSVPDFARPMNDGLYRAIDIYLKAHPWLTDLVRESLCHLIDCQKLSLEACTHAAQNQRLPLRTIVEVLFFEQLHLRSSVAQYLFFSNENPNGGPRSPALGFSRDLRSLKARVVKLENECRDLRKDIERLVPPVRGRRNLGLGFSVCRKTDDASCSSETS